MSTARSNREIFLRRAHDYWIGTFQAMASPCEFLTRVDSESLAHELLVLVSDEAWRIEDKFSRYLPENIVDRINSSNGQANSVDEETGKLFDFAETLFQMSDGRFDITSGALRRAWTFDGSDAVPNSSQIEDALQRVGWQKVTWNDSVITLEPGMQIDFGGIGKEYAVDRTAAIAAEYANADCMINFGGDLVVVTHNLDATPWRVGIESITAATEAPERVISLQNGALATSGDARRYVVRNGVRYGHVLDCRTGWPVRNAPRSVTVAADTCTQAGMLATLAMLEGSGAEDFLETQSVQYWCLR